MINIQSIQPDKDQLGSRMEQVTSSTMGSWNSSTAQNKFSLLLHDLMKKFCGLVNKPLYIVKAMKLHMAVNTMRNHPLIYCHTLGKCSRSCLIFRRNNFYEK